MDYQPMMRDSSADRTSTAAASATDRRGATTTLSVYWCGTDGVLAPATTQIGLFFLLTTGHDVSHSSHGHGADDSGGEELARILSARAAAAASPEGGLHLKMGFDGCGQTNGCAGMICATGLREQCRCVVRRVEQLLAHLAGRDRGRPLVLNVLGLSRGGIAAMKLAQMLADIDPATLELNMCLFDPVPGNLLVSAAIDHLLGGCLTTARQAIDLGASQNLRRCLSIYPHVPLPSIAFHAPIVPRFPALTEVTELVTLDCHQGAFFPPHFEAFDHPSDTYLRNRREPMQLAGVLSFHCVSKFLESCGTVLERNSSLELTAARRENVLAALEREASRGGTDQRGGHGHGRAVRFIRHAPDATRSVAGGDAGPRQVFLNEQHYRLARGLEWFSFSGGGVADDGGSGGGGRQQREQIGPEARSKFLLQREHGRPLLAALCCCG